MNSYYATNAELKDNKLIIDFEPSVSGYINYTSIKKEYIFDENLDIHNISTVKTTIEKMVRPISPNYLRPYENCTIYFSGEYKSKI